MLKRLIRRILRFKPVREALDEELGAYFDFRNDITLR